MYSTLKENAFNYNQITEDGYITSNGSLSNGIIVDNNVCRKEIQIINIDNIVNNSKIYVNNTNHDVIVDINLQFTYDITSIEDDDIIKIHNKIIQISPLNNNVSFTHLCKLPVNNYLTCVYNSYSTMKILNITGTITVYSFVDI